MKKYLLAAISSLALVASSSTWAADATITVSGGSSPGTATYTLNSLMVDANGNITLSVTASGGGTGNPDPNPNPTPTTKTLTIGQPSAGGQISVSGSGLTINGSTATVTCTTGVDCPQVTATLTVQSGYNAGSWGGLCSGSAANTCTFVLGASGAISATTTVANPTIPGNCPTPNGEVVTVNTPMSGASFPQALAGYSPNPTDIYAFKVTVPTGTTQKIGQFALAYGGNSGSLLVVSECPGDIETSGKGPGCYGYVVQASNLYYAVNRPDLANRPLYCALTPGKTYYVNVAKRESPTSPVNCTSPATCKFYFSGS